MLADGYNLSSMIGQFLKFSSLPIVQGLNGIEKKKRYRISFKGFKLLKFSRLKDPL